MNSKQSPSLRKSQWIVLLIVFLSTLIGYIARMSVSVALKSISQSFNWTTSEEGSLGGILLGIFLVSYGISNIFLSPFIDKIGAKKVLSISILSWSLTLVLASIFGHLYPMLLLSRVLLGLSQGVLFPVANKITASWVSESKRALATTAFLSGGPIGSLLTPLIVVPIIVKSSWQVSFYFISILGIALIPFVVYFIKDNPTGQKQQKKDLNIQSNMKTLLFNREFQVLLVGFITACTIWWGVSLWLPTYFLNVQRLTANEMSYATTLSYVGAIAGMIFASSISEITKNRKNVIVSGVISAGILILLLTLLHIQSKTIAVSMFFLIFFTGQMLPPIFFTIMQTRISIQLVGTATGLMNGLGNGFGVIGPVLVGFIIALTGSYPLGLASIGVLALMGGIIFLLFYKETDKLFI